MTSNAALLMLLSVAAPAPSIDGILAETYRSQGITPAPRCSDGEFLRRVSLDLIGRIPTLEEIRRFEKNPDRSAKIDELLAAPEFSKFWSEIWTATLVGYSNAFASDREALRMWLQRSVQKKMPYDELATQLITAKGDSAFNGAVNFLIRHPEDPVVTVSRLFLGVRLDCARCHNHPFDRWTQKNFEEMGRFFEVVDLREVSEGNIRVTNRVVGREEEDRPRFLTGARPRTSQWREELALFITYSKPFARTFGNRLWYHFMGRGIVHPVDDFNKQNDPSVPALVEFLATQAREKKFDMRVMARLICNSGAYQRSSVRKSRNPDHEAVFAYRLLKPLTPEQAFDSLVQALKVKNPREYRREFIERAVGERIDESLHSTWEYRESVQGLMRRLALDLPVPSRQVDELFLRIMSRKPTDRERKLCQGRPAEDIVFALVNSNEFFFNH